MSRRFYHQIHQWRSSICSIVTSMSKISLRLLPHWRTILACDISILMKAMPSRINWIAVDDFTWNIASLNAASDSNHHCYIEPDECNNSNDPKCNRRSKIYSLLSARKKYSEHLCPMGIETVQKYDHVQPLSIVYETFRMMNDTIYYLY